MSLAIRAVQASLNDAYSIVSASSDPASLDLLAADRQVNAQCLPDLCIILHDCSPRKTFT